MGGFRFRETRKGIRIAGRTTAGLSTTGEQAVWLAEAPGLGPVELACIRWASGEREIRRSGGSGAEPPDPSRLEIQCWGADWLGMDLGHLPPVGEHDGPPRAASEYELDAAAHACVRCALQAAGATAMGTRQEVLGVSDERRHHLCTTFPRHAHLVPVVVFALTRLAPLLRLERARGA